MNSTILVPLKALLGFSILLLITRFVGKKQLGQLTYLTYITGISIGNMAGDMVVYRNVKVMDAVVGLVSWSLFVFIFEYISLKSSKVRAIVDGEPTIVIKKGRIIEESLDSLKLNIGDLKMLLRNKNVFSIREVDYAILEPNGQLSVLKKPEEELVNKRDMKIPVNIRKFVPLSVILDGKIVEKNMKEFELSEEWLQCQLRVLGIDSVENVIYAELQSDGSLYVNEMMQS
ncbi:DUF421 domain-containing protein [Wukongibacter baidiensis]|uniref:YetF domain-containing protein n=1 Tax=Wukongibacter baidiensis TaxID=1723361 RepID=UPI003D7F4121